MLQLFLGLLILIFGVFLKTTKDPGFAKSKKFSWMFILIGILSIMGKLVIMYQQGEL
ncbi:MULTISPECIES: hypothetical protein [Chryseobacterium]|uniref:Uncharacterized protein n=1 Tax=Chryseobacterium salivictor TaxID=2547600 RepID=A0A4P6ZEL1_9FLAO|nr:MULTISPECIES: hypothetical protein [Chryseobacterium]MDQ0476156.1 hypothetical protein [Chryseobacterium sp. MDT2-18]QBO58011.1 hypothetical protein NBC122_01184 [Chryseobacterium salivictor]